MDFISLVFNLACCLWDCTDRNTASIRLLEGNLDSLEDDMNELKNINQDVKRRVELAAEQQLQRTNEVGDWLERVEKIEKEVNEILRKGAEEMQKRCLCKSCPKNCRSSYKLGNTVTQKIDAVRKLINKGHFFNVVANRLPGLAQVDERPTGMTVGLDPTIGEVWRCLKEKNVGIIGIYGMGGVGKTTLLRKINNKFRNTGHKFSVVLWVVVSKEGNLKQVQEAIRRKLGISDGIWSEKTEDERATEIHNILCTKKFILLIDDLWERLDLLRVGVPLPNSQNECKVIFATRSEEVCCQMGAHRRVRLKCLPPDDALHLFRYNVGEDAWKSHPEIPELAAIVARECKGLPLALITIGRAMSSRRDPQEWTHAIKVLHSYPSKFSGMGDHVFPVLEFSYDSLSDDTIKACFLYCSIFPEDHNIRKDKLIELWIGEGFLSDSDNIFQARNRGVYIIRSLVLACLLESSESEEFVSMHDMIRDMALWLSCEHGKNKNKILVQEFSGPIKPSRLMKWKEAEKISISCHIGNLAPTPPCPNLLTLLVRSTKGVAFPSEFFKFMETLRVLDLSDNQSLKELPPQIGELINLEFLDLSSTAIEELPTELRNLKKMKFLLLDDTTELRRYPLDMIRSLPSLEVFSEFKEITRYYYVQDWLYDKEMTLLDELEHLEQLQDISFTLFSTEAARKLEYAQIRKAHQTPFTCWVFGEILLQSTIFVLRKNEASGDT